MTKPQSLPVEEARKKFADVLDGSQFRSTHTEITRRGKPAGYVVPPEWYEAAVEALADTRRQPAPPTPPAVAAPRQQVTQAVPEPDDDAVELTTQETRQLIRLAYARATGEQPEHLHRAAKTAKSLNRDEDLAVLEAAYEMGLLADADVVAVREQIGAVKAATADATEES